MITAIVALVALGLAPQDPPKSIFSQVIGVPTGKNGYEEYCRAADIARSPHISKLVNACFNGPESGLKERAVLVAECTPIFELIRNGNAKEVFEPRKSLDVNTMFPEFASFKQIAKIYQARVYVQMARGNSDGAVTSLIEGLTFADRTARTTLIAYLVRNAMFAIMYSELGPRFEAISVSGCEKLISFCNQFLEQKDPLEGCLRGEALLFQDAFKSAGDSGELLELGNWASEFEQLNADGRTRLRADVFRRHEKLLNEMVAQLYAPESSWDKGGTETEASSLAEAVVKSLAPIYSQVFLSTLKIRTQMRLLRLHAAIQHYRWERLNFPASLSLLPSNFVNDPANDGKFEYTLIGNDYELFSKGTSSLGPIHLKYRSSKSQPEEVLPPSAYN